MLLESLARRQISQVLIRVDPILTERQIFSSKALQQFLEGNTMLKTLQLWGLQIDAEACATIGRGSHVLDLLLLCVCKLLDAQQFANGVQANMCGPTRLGISHCQVGSNVDFSSFLMPLLGNPSLKELAVMETSISSGNFEVLNAALASNQSLEVLRIVDALHIHQSI
jgi:hypothetical protein